MEFTDIKAPEPVAGIPPWRDPLWLAEAEDWGADLIIVGAHKLSMATYLLGSTASAIVRHANCTVMVVRGDKPASLL